MTALGAAPLLSSPPRRRLPDGACDSHTHVFGLPEKFPSAGGGTYEPPAAPYEAYRAMLRGGGLTYGVVVQPAVYLGDHSVLLDACARSGGTLRGIGSAAATVSDEELARLRSGGVVGLRFVEVADPAGGGRFKGSVGFDDLFKLAPRLKALGMQAHLWADCDRLVADAPRLQGLGIPLVADHMARPNVSAGPVAPVFQRFLRYVADGTFWVKLSLCRVSAQLAAARPFHDALIAANQHRLVWASDWPHVRMGTLAPDIGRLIDLFDDWTAGDEGLRQRIFVDNPHGLFALKHGWDARL